MIYMQSARRETVECVAGARRERERDTDEGAWDSRTEPAQARY